MTPIFHSIDADSLVERTRLFWSLEGSLPAPIGSWLHCPVCGGDEVQARSWTFHRRPKNATLRGRCDVRFKCCGCGAVWLHGIALPDEYYRVNGRHRERKRVHWRDAKAELGS